MNEKLIRLIAFAFGTVAVCGFIFLVITIADCTENNRREENARMSISVMEFMLSERKKYDQEQKAVKLHLENFLNENVEIAKILAKYENDMKELQELRERYKNEKR